MHYRTVASFQLQHYNTIKRVDHSVAIPAGIGRYWPILAGGIIYEVFECIREGTLVLRRFRFCSYVTIYFWFHFKEF